MKRESEREINIQLYVAVYGLSFYLLILGRQETPFYDPISSTCQSNCLISSLLLTDKCQVTPPLAAIAQSISRTETKLLNWVAPWAVPPATVWMNYRK